MRNNKCLPLCLLLGLLILLAGCTGSATQLTRPAQEAPGDVEEVEKTYASPLDLPALVWGAGLIVEGSVSEVKDTREETPGRIVTDYQVDISTILKRPQGFAERSVIIKQQGGTYGGKTQVISGDEPYKVGDQVLLFLVDLSIYPRQTRPGVKTFSVMMPGGRFQLKADGSLDTPTKNHPVADAYRGKNKSALERDILARVPTSLDYLQQEVERSFLVVEGKVGSLQKTWMSMDGVTTQQLAELKSRGELPELVYAFYSFAVDKVLKDELTRAKDYPHRTSAYKSAPVKAGDVITLAETGGTYEGITLRRTLAPFLKPGDRMLLFLSAIGCGDRLSICTQAEQKANKVIYHVWDGAGRFLIGPDNRLTAVGFGPTSQSYTGQSVSKLEQDVTLAKTKWEKALEEQMMRPTSVPPSRPPIPTAVPRP